jgi:hypothetical protein
MTATYRGERELVLGEADEGGEVEKLRVGVIELDLQLASSVDRAPLYRSALPDVERREPARVDSVPLLWTFQGKGELLWDLAGGHFHSLSISGKESFDISVNKTLYVAGREPSPYSQHARYSGTLTWEVTAGEPTALDDGGARASGDPNDKAAKKAAKKKRRNKK